MDELLTQFLIEGRELVAEAQAHLEALGADPADPIRIDGAFRAFHTLKGSVGLFDMAPAGRILHAAEDLLERARAQQSPLGGRQVAALVETIDQIDRWIDAMDEAGHLPADATARGAALNARLAPPAPSADPARHGPVDDGGRGDGGDGGEGGGGEGSGDVDGAAWLAALLASAASILGEDGQPLVAFRYVPDTQCYFRGDDPMRIVAGVPDVVALRVLPRTGWPALDALSPFECHLAIEGVALAPLDAVRSAFRSVGDEVSILLVPARLRADSLATTRHRSLRVDESRIDALAADVGELVLVGNALAHLSADAARADAALGARLRQVQATLERNLGSLHRNVTAVRMVSLAPTLRRLPRMVREIADELGRAVRFTMEGERTEVDKAIADMLFEPLLHLVRNAVDHGVEPPEHRRLAGKPDAGAIALSVRRDGDSVVLRLSDDGAGLDRERIRAGAVERGLLDAAAADGLGDAALFALVFAPGFSTARSVTTVSGRGVGMDAVKTAVEAVGGSVAIDSRPGEGTTSTLRLPLSAITTRLLLVRAGGSLYGVPFHAIMETAIVGSRTIVPIGGGEALVLRDRTVPVVDLADLLGERSARADQSKVLIVQAGGDRVALVVEGFEPPIDALVRPPAKLLAALPGIAGTSVLGDGQVLLVLDPARLVA